MLDIPEKIKELYRANNIRQDTRKVIKLRFYDEKIKLLHPDEKLFPSDDLFPVDQEPFLVIDNSQISQESLVVTESLCENQNITFGECNASQVEIIVADVSLDVTNKEFMLTVEVGNYEMALGIYRVESFVRQADRRLRKITAYDRMRYFDVDVAAWYQGLDFPMNLKAFRDSLCAHIGIEQTHIALPLDDMQITRTIEPEKLSGRDVLKAICEINGCFGHMEKTGRLKYIALEVSGLYPSEELFPSEDLFPAEMLNAEVLSYYKQSETTYEDFVVYGIDFVSIRQEEGDVGATYGSGKTGYTIEGNFLVYGKSNEQLLMIASVVHDNISGRIYKPAKITGAALPWVEVGDGIICHTSDDIIETYCLKRTIKGIQAMMDTYEAKGEKERKESFGIQSQIIQLEGKTAVIVRNVDEVSVKLTNLKDYTEAQFRITAEQILAEVKRAQEAEATLKIYADRIALDVKDFKTDTASKFEQTANQIAMKVSKGEVSSHLSIEPDAITLKTNRLSWESDNSRMTKQGDLWCRNGNFSGDINASSINGSSIYGCQFEGGQLDVGRLFADEDRLEFGRFRLTENGGRLESGDFWVKPGPGGEDSAMGIYQINCFGDMVFPYDSWTEGDSALDMFKDLYDRTNNLSRRVSDLEG